MVVKKFYATRADGVNLYRTYSTEGFKIRKLVKNRMGEFVKSRAVYDAAIDVEGAPFEYEETDIPVDNDKG
jgi:hypothetical protein